MSYLDDILANTAKTRKRTSTIADITQTLAREPLPTGGPASIAAVSQQIGPPPSAKKGGEGVEAWINQALGILKLDSSYAPGIRNMIMKESGGNPRAINKWDSNWKKGTPSKGLMQTIDPTFQRWALPGYNKDVYDPVSNIIAGIRYAQNRYGDGMLKSGGRKNRSGKYIGY